MAYSSRRCDILWEANVIWIICGWEHRQSRIVKVSRLVECFATSRSEAASSTVICLPVQQERIAVGT